MLGARNKAQKSNPEILSSDEVHFINLFDLLILSKVNLNLAQVSDLDWMKQD